jgi:spermidine dehydrogenase
VRLNSIAVSVANAKDGKGPVDIGYVREGKLHRIQAKRAVLACYNMIIPYLMPELPAAQKAALAASVKLPLVYGTVAIRNWHSWVMLGVDEIYSPYGFFSNVKLDYPVSLGGYRNPRNPSEPILLHLVHVPRAPNQRLSNVEQFRLGRQQLLETSFETFEAQIRDQLDRMLGPGGFQSARDIAAITVNRWPHGYAYQADSLFDNDTTPPLYETARQRSGQVAIANSDAAWNAYAHEAIDQAWRAVGELKRA